MTSKTPPPLPLPPPLSISFPAALSLSLSLIYMLESFTSLSNPPVTSVRLLFVFLFARVLLSCLAFCYDLFSLFPFTVCFSFYMFLYVYMSYIYFYLFFLFFSFFFFFYRPLNDISVVGRSTQCQWGSFSRFELNLHHTQKKKR